MTKPSIAIASSHARHDRLQQEVSRRLPGFEVLRVRTREQLAALADAPLKPEWVFVPHWSWIIPEAVYARLDCVIFHMTDLPYGRGGSPLQNLIVRGHEDTMLSAFRCQAGVDTGLVYLKRPLSLAGSAGEILARAAESMIGMIVEIVERRPTPTPQQGEATAFARRKPADGNLAGVASPAQVYDFIRMLDADGYPPAFLDLGPLRLEFRGASMADGVVEASVRIKERSDG